MEKSLNRVVEIYQLDADNSQVFEDATSDVVDMTEYKKVYKTLITLYNQYIDSTDREVLSIIFQHFNINRPDDYKARSLSVSDVVILDGIKYYCQKDGWKLVYDPNDLPKEMTEDEKQQQADWQMEEEEAIDPKGIFL